MSTALLSPLPLAFVITELEVGGAEQALVHLATGLSRERFSPAVYSLQARPKNDLLVKRLEQAEIPVHFLNIRSRFQFFGARSRLIKHLRNQQPQIVQSFLFHANLISAIAARAARVPRVVAGIRVADPSFLRQRVERSLTPRMDKIVCVSQGVADFCAERCRFPPEKLVVIPNGVELARFQSVPPADLTALGLPESRRAILFVGRLDKQKGLDWLIAEVLPRVYSELPGHDLVLVGDGPQRDALKALAEKQGLASRIHFAGRRADVPQILAASDLLVLPSRWEGMPNVLLEAMAAGRPVVATRAEGVCDALGDAAEEQSAPCGDAAGFAERMIRLVQDKRAAAELGSRNQRRAAAEFSIAAMVNRYAALYESLTPR